MPNAKYQGLAERHKQFYGLFRDVEPGDRYRLIYRPDKGTELHLNDELLGTAPGADFAIAYFGIGWGRTQSIRASGIACWEGMFDESNDCRWSSPGVLIDKSAWPAEPSR